MEDNIQKLLRQNLEYAKKNHELALKTRRYIFWAQILGIIKFVLVVVPIVFAIIYAMPYLQRTLALYQSLLEGLNTSEVPSGMTVEMLKALVK